MAAIAWLVVARLRHRPIRWLLIALGIAAATIVPVLAHSRADLVAGQTLAYGLDRLDPGLRTLAVSRTGVRQDDQTYAAADTEIRDALRQLSDRPPRAQVLFRRLADPSGTDYFLGGTDDIASAVAVTEGRLPAHCTQARCEVVVIGTGTPILDPALHLVIVGRAVRTDPSLLSGTFGSTGAPILLGNGVLAVAALDPLAEFQRSYGWALPVDLSKIRELGADGYLRRSHDVELRLSIQGLVLTAPDDVLTEQSQLAQRSTRRFGLLAGAEVALLLAFSILGAIGLRRDHGAVRELLRRRGARGWQRFLLGAGTAVVPVTVGTVAGLAIGTAVAARRAHDAGIPGWPGAAAALHGSLGTVAIGWLLGVILVTATLNWPDNGDATSAWRVVDALAIAGLMAAALAVSRGTVTASGLDAGTDPVLLALPILTVICGGLLLARLWPLAARAAAAVLPDRFLGMRLGLLGAVRRPLRPVATAAFLGAATATLVFAGGYRATLAQGARDQAAFGVPLSARLTVGEQLRRPLDLATLSQYEATVPGTRAYPVLRATGSVHVNAVQTVTVPLLGVDPSALQHIAGWDRLVGGGTPAASAALIDARDLSRFRPADGLAVPAGTTAITIPVSGAADPLDFNLVLRLPSGTDLGVPLHRTGDTFTATMPPLPSDATLFALTFTESVDYATHHQHHLGEGNGTDLEVVNGTVTLAAPQFNGAPAAGWNGWGATAATVTPEGSGMRVKYSLTGVRVVVRAGFDEPDPAVPVLVDPATAALASNGLLRIDLDSATTITGRVAGVLPRFPTMDGQFAVADVRALGDAIEGRQPGVGVPTEMWLSAPPGQEHALGAALTQAPFTSLRVDLQYADRDYLASDPLATGASNLLRDNALLGLVVALLGIGLLVVAERRDESAELYAWECDGLPPKTLRRVLFTRAASVIAVAVPGGVALGLVLSTVTTKIVKVTAAGTTPQPPLALAFGAAWVAAIVVGAIAIGLAAAAVAAGTALREPLPPQPQVTS